jgi:hypothetical protein
MHFGAGRKVQLYVMDLNSANGTFVNNTRIEPQKYVQVLEKVCSMLLTMYMSGATVVDTR